MSMNAPPKTDSVRAEDLLATINRAMPSDDDAEKGVLSCLLQDSDRIAESRRVLPVESFYHEGWRTIYEALLAMDAQMPRTVIDIVTVTHYLRNSGRLEKVGGAGTVTELLGFVPISAHYPHYTKILRNLFIRRQLVKVGAQISTNAFEYGLGAEGEGQDGIVQLVTAAESLTFAVLESTRDSTEHSTQAKPASQGVSEWIDYNERITANRGKIVGLETGILEFDSTFHGIDDQEGELFVIAGRPGQGKTAMACSIANHLAVKCGVPGVVFSIEMSGNQFYTRMILGMAGVDTSKAMTGHYSKMDQQSMSAQYAKLKDAPLFVCDNAALNEMEILAQLQYFKRMHNIRWFMVDHLHKVRHSNPKIQADERQRLVNVMEVFRYAKKQLSLGGMILVQLSRETDRNKGSAPTLADLSGSGAIEQDTEKVAVLHRPPYYMPWHRLDENLQDAWRQLVEPRRNRNRDQWSDGCKYSDEDGGFARQDYEEDCIAYVLKNRSGPTPEVHIRYEAEFTRFSSRMPRLNSDNDLDWQIGTYRAAAAKKQPKAKQVSSYSSAKKKTWSAADPDWHKEFTDPSDD